jgi:hypothetical protein
MELRKDKFYLLYFRELHSIKLIKSPFLNEEQAKLGMKEFIKKCPKYKKAYFEILSGQQIKDLGLGKARRVGSKFKLARKYDYPKERVSTFQKQNFRTQSRRRRRRAYARLQRNNSGSSK